MRNMGAYAYRKHMYSYTNYIVDGRLCMVCIFDKRKLAISEYDRSKDIISSLLSNIIEQRQA